MSEKNDTNEPWVGTKEIAEHLGVKRILFINGLKLKLFHVLE